jgi:aminoglycoside phosphotransferase (APT) family kinase protein
LLHIRGNAVYHLPHNDAIARIRFAPTRPEVVRDQLTAALQATSWLRRLDFPVTEPLDLDQPIAVDGHLATFWHYATVIVEGARDALTLGKLIRRLHSVPAPDISLPPANPLGSLRTDLHDCDAITPADREWLLASADLLEQRYLRATWTLGSGLIHGDAHVGNLLHAVDAVVLGDWDAVSHGPREIDLVPMSMWYRYGRPRTEWEEFCAGYGTDPAGPPGISLLQELRELQALASYARNSADPAHREELTRRVTSLKEGDKDLPWRAL